MSTDLHPGIWTHRPLGSGAPPAQPQIPAQPQTPPDPGTQAGIGHRLDRGFDFAVKANIEVAGMPATAASPVFEGHVPQADSPVVAVLKRHGGRVAGLTNMHELAFGITSNNAVYGPVRNPFDPLRSAGGSSGGSAAAVAAGLVPVSLGTDTGGSISIPAAACGVVGFRPTTGRWPTAGTIGLSWSRDTIGVHARNVEHVATVDRWVSHDVRDAPSTGRPVLGVPAAFRLDLDAEVQRSFAEALDKISAHAQIVELDMDQVFAQTNAAQWDLVGWEAPRLLGVHLAAAENLSPADAWKQVVSRAASPDVRGILAGYNGNPVDPNAYAAACGLMDAAREDYAALLVAAGVDALVFPTLPCLPPAIGEDGLVPHLGEYVPVFPLMTRHTGPGTVLGAPAVTLPAGPTATGLPVGITLQGLAHRDRELLALAGLVESLLGRVAG